jgi:hypothetical protein
MTPDTSGWRDEAAYAFMDAAGVDDLAWECLRRNTDYQRDYVRLLEKASQNDPLPSAMRDRWGLRFRCPAKPLHRRPGRLLDL